MQKQKKFVTIDAPEGLRLDNRHGFAVLVGMIPHNVKRGATEYRIKSVRVKDDGIRLVTIEMTR